MNRLRLKKLFRKKDATIQINKERKNVKEEE